MSDSVGACCTARPPAGERFDLAILGGGSAAFAAARKATGLGARVLLVNEGPIGGTCVNIGCVPSKTMIRAAENHHAHGLSRFRGLAAAPGRIDFAALVREKDELVEQLRTAKYEDVLAGLKGVQRVEGRGQLRGPHAVEVAGIAYRAEKVLLATGARPARPAIPGLDLAGVWDSTQALAATRLPRRLVVLGGRSVALELGQLFARLGSRVTIVQRSARILPEEDGDLADALSGFLEGEGLEVRAGHQVRGVTRGGDDLHVAVERAGREELLVADAVLAALGRQPNTEQLGLEAIGVALESGGFVRVGDDLQTSVPGIYAAGDVIGDPAFVYAAAYEGALAAENALASTTRARDYTAIPWVIFTDPQVAGVGLCETQAAAAGVEVDVSVVPLSQVPRALAARDLRGFVKLLRARGEDRLVGARILAPEGSEQIMEASLLIKFDLSVAETARHFHPYLTQSEAIKLALIGFDTDVKGLSCCAS